LVFAAAGGFGKARRLGDRAIVADLEFLLLADYELFWRSQRGKAATAHLVTGGGGAVLFDLPNRPDGLLVGLDAMAKEQAR
jgi:hypothetical protein